MLGRPKSSVYHAPISFIELMARSWDSVLIFIGETHKWIDTFLKCTAVIFNLINKLKGYD